MDIVDKLLSIKYTRERSDGPNGYSWDEPCEADDYGAKPSFVNPNGKEAADEIELLRKERDGLREALSDLLDAAEDVFVCMADATGIDRHNYPEPYLKARATLKETE